MPERGSLPRIATAALIAALAFGSGWFTARHTQSPRAFPEVAGMVWPRWAPLQPFTLRRADGASFGSENLRGHWTLLFFGYASCPDVCPATLATLARIRTALMTDAAFKRTGQVLFVSVDPERDTPERLRAYAAHFDSGIIAASAPREALRDLLGQFDAPLLKVSGADAAEYWYEHPASIYLIDPDLRVTGKFAPPLDPAAIAASVTAISAAFED